MKQKQLSIFKLGIQGKEYDKLELQILLSFFPEANGMNRNELVEKSGYSYERVYHALGELEKKKAVQISGRGHNKLFVPKLENFVFHTLFGHYSALKRLSLFEKYESLRKILEEFKIDVKAHCIVLFGSYAKKTATKKSDIDLLCVGADKKEVEKTASSLKHKYNYEISPTIIEAGEFIKIKEENPVFWKDLRKYGIVLGGESFFFRFMYKD